MRGVTPQQDALLVYLREREETPSYSQMSRDLGLSKSGIHALICQLSDRGFVTFIPNRARSIRVIDDRPGPEGIPQPRPLAHYATNALIDEIGRRGFVVGKRQ